MRNVLSNVSVLEDSERADIISEPQLRRVRILDFMLRCVIPVLARPRSIMLDAELDELRILP